MAKAILAILIPLVIIGVIVAAIVQSEADDMRARDSICRSSLWTEDNPPPDYC